MGSSSRDDAFDVDGVVLGRLDSGNANAETRQGKPTSASASAMNERTRRSGRQEGARFRMEAHAKSDKANASSASKVLPRVNAQHSASDPGDHHGWTHIPKRADRRRAIARFTTAIIRAAGHPSFISREGVGYRKAFDRFLVDTYGKTFEEGQYWHKNTEIEPFFRMILYIATEGALNISNEDVKFLFTKKEERQAAEWVLDEDVLGKLGLSAKDVAIVYEGKPRKSPRGFARGIPLEVPPETTLPPQPVPFLEATIRGVGEKFQDYGEAKAAMPPPPSRSRAPQLILPQAPSSVPLDIQKLFASLPTPVTPLTRGLSLQLSRQYSSDLSRLMSEFDSHPSHADEFVRTYLARSASELDAVAAIQIAEKAEVAAEEPSNKRARR